MKKFLALLLVFTMLFLCACPLTNDTLGERLEFIENYIDSTAGGVSLVLCYAMRPNSKKVRIDASVNASPTSFGANVESVIQATKAALKQYDKKLGELMIGTAFNDEAENTVSWITENYRSGELHHDLTDIIPNGRCSLTKLKTLYNQNNAEIFDELKEKTLNPEPTTLSPSRQLWKDEEYISKQLEPLNIENKIETEAMLLQGNSLDAYWTRLSIRVLPESENPLIFAEKIHEILNVTEHALQDRMKKIDVLSLYYFSPFLIEYRMIRWVSSDMKIGNCYAFKHDTKSAEEADADFSQEFTLDELIQFIAADTKIPE